MFTIDQILSAHSKVKSGVDFPVYIKDLIKLGVIGYETFVANGHTDFFGTENFKTSTNPKYGPLVISDKNDAAQFQLDLKSHQEGKTNYPTFCEDCAKSGVYKWVVNMSKMTCSYLDKNDKLILVENIPQ